MKRGIVAKMMKAWEAKATKRAANATGFTLMAVSLAACNDDAAAPAAGGTGATSATQSFVLTAGNDTFTGGDGSDIFNAGLTDNGIQTLQTLDSLNGGGGTDTLNVTLNTAGTVVTPTLTSIEVVNISNTAAATIDLIGAASVTSVNVIAPGAAMTINNIAAPTAAISVANMSTAQTVTFDVAAAAVTGAADEQTLTLSNVTNGTVAIDAGIEAINIVSAGAANTLAALTSSANSIAISGSQNLTITAADTNAETIVSTATGNITLASNNANATTITTAGGADNITIGGGAAVVETVSTGAGNDTVTFTANLADTDVLDGGAGVDTLASTFALLNGLTTTTAAVSNISNFETVEFTDAFTAAATFTVANVQTTGIDRVVLDALGTAGAATINFLAGSSTLSVAGVLGGALAVDAAGSATTDSLAINNTDAAANAFAGRAITSTDFETLTISTSGTGAATDQTLGAITMTASAGGTTTLNVTGTNQLDTGVITANVINASGMTAQATGNTFVMGAAAVGSTTITGSAGADTLVGAATATTINGGAGNDTITGGAGNDVLNGDAGNDTITSGAGTDTINGGDGNDTVNMDTNLSIGDVVNGGAGTDTLAIDAAATAAVAAGVTNFETLRLDTINLTQDMAQFTGNAGFTTLTANHGAGTAAFTNVRDDVTTLSSITTGASVSLARLVDGTANSLAITGAAAGAVTIVAATVNDEETLQLNVGSVAAADLTITTLNASDLTTLTIGGAGDTIITDAIVGSTALATVDASASTGAVTVNATNSAVAVTMTAGSGISTLTGGTGNDVITGGAGNDVLTGGAGNDTIVGGAGTDAINGGVGADTLTGGAGVDTFTQELTHSVAGTAFFDASTGNAMAAAAVIAVGDTITFGNGVDVITDFVAGAAGDVMDVNTAGAALNSALGLAANAIDGGNAADLVFLSGSFNANTNVFTVAANGAGADTMILDVVDGTVGDNLLTSTSIFILRGVDSDDLVAANFV